jgi:hypothetical protein
MIESIQQGNFIHGVETRQDSSSNIYEGSNVEDTAGTTVRRRDQNVIMNQGCSTQSPRPERIRYGMIRRPQLRGRTAAHYQIAFVGSPVFCTCLRHPFCLEKCGIDVANCIRGMDKQLP